MFYTGQWGGGDAKLLMALGAIIGFEVNKLAFGSSFLINLVFVGGIWGLLWSMGLAIQNFKPFIQTFKKLRNEKNYRRLRITTLFVAIGLLITAYFTEMYVELVGLALVTYAFCYLTILIKTVEFCCMQKMVTPDVLTEGDWLLHPVKVGKTEIVPGKLGLDKKQVQKLKQLYAEKKIDKLLVKYGIPFGPAFLFAFIVTLVWNNIAFAILF